LQSKARQAAQASCSQVSNFARIFSIFTTIGAKEASDTMLVAATLYADAFWRQSAWYLSILVDLLLKPCQEKMEKIENFLVRKERIIVRIEKYYC
jgi:hypothetical protein